MGTYGEVGGTRVSAGGFLETTPPWVWESDPGIGTGTGTAFRALRGGEQSRPLGGTAPPPTASDAVGQQLLQPAPRLPPRTPLLPPCPKTALPLGCPA